MRLFYITNSRLPTDKAHGVQIAKMGEALVEAGVDLQLILPARDNPIKGSVEEYYGLRTTLPAIYIPVVDFLLKVKTTQNKYVDMISSLLETTSFYLLIFFFTFLKKGIVFTRDHYSPIFIFGKRRIIWEVHELPEMELGKKLYLFIAGKVGAVIAVNKAVEDFFNKNKIKTYYLPNAVDLRMFSHLEIRSKSKHIQVGYLGSLYARKGVDTLVLASKLLPQKYQVALCGGPEEERTRLKKISSRVRIIPSVPYRQVPNLLKSFDVLVLPNSGRDVLSSEQTSPLKLYEYLASGQPVVAANVPSVSSVVTKKQVIFFIPDDPVDLAKKIILATRCKKSKSNFPKPWTVKFRAEEITKICQTVLKNIGESC